MIQKTTPQIVSVCRPVDEWLVIALAWAHTSQYFLRHEIVASGKLYMIS